MAPSAIEIDQTPILAKVNKPASPRSPLPVVQEFDAATVTVDQLVEALKLAGGVVVRNMLSQQELSEIEADVRPWLEKDIPWEGDYMRQ